MSSPNNPDPATLIRLLQGSRLYQPAPRLVRIQALAPSVEAAMMRDHIRSMPGVRNAEVFTLEEPGNRNDSPEVIEVELAAPGSAPLMLLAAPPTPQRTPSKTQILFHPPHHGPIATVPAGNLDPYGTTSAAIDELTTIVHACYDDLNEKLADMRKYKRQNAFRYARQVEWWVEERNEKVTIKKDGSTYDVTTTVRDRSASPAGSKRVPESYSLSPKRMTIFASSYGNTNCPWDFTLLSGRLSSATCRKKVGLAAMDGPSDIRCNDTGEVIAANWYFNRRNIPPVPRSGSSIAAVGEFMVGVRKTHNGKIPEVYWKFARDLLKDKPGAFKALKKLIEFGNRMAA